jgi:hypothetical protein
MSILKLAAMLTLDGTGFKAGLKEAEVASNKFAAQVKSKLTGAFGATAISFAVKQLIDYNSKIRDTATALDISTDALQEQTFWATQNGASMDDLAMAYKGLAKARAEALGGGKQVGLFAAMGISEADLRGSSIESLFKRVADKFRTTDFGGDKMAAAQGLFGRGGMAMLPALEQSLADASTRAHELAQIIGVDVNSALEEMGDRLDVIGTALKNVGSVSLLGVIKGVDLGITTLGMGILGLEQQSIRFLHAILATIGQIPGMKTPALQGMLRDRDAEVGMASDEMFNAMLDRYDPAKLAERTARKKRGEEIFVAPIKPEVIAKAVAFHASRAAQLSAGSLTSVGQWSGRNLIGSGGSNDPTEKLRHEQEKTTKAVEKLAEKLKPKTLIAVP